MSCSPYFQTGNFKSCMFTQKLLSDLSCVININKTSYSGNNYITKFTILLQTSIVLLSQMKQRSHVQEQVSQTIQRVRRLHTAISMLKYTLVDHRWCKCRKFCCHPGLPKCLLDYALCYRHSRCQEKHTYVLCRKKNNKME